MSSDDFCEIIKLQCDSDAILWFDLVAPLLKKDYIYFVWLVQAWAIADACQPISVKLLLDLVLKIVEEAKEQQTHVNPISHP